MSQASINRAWKNASEVIGKTIQTTLKGVEQVMEARAYSASNALRSAALFVLKGQGSGRRYKVPGTHKRQRDKVSGKMRNGVYYTASAPGEVPAKRLGDFMGSWMTQVRVERRGKKFYAIASIESNIRAGNRPLGDILEKGTSRMKPRPYKQAVVDRAMPRIKELYKFKK